MRGWINVENYIIMAMYGHTLYIIVYVYTHSL